MFRCTSCFAVLMVLVGLSHTEAATIFQHLGKTDPTTEDWTPEVAGGGVTAGPVENDLGLGINAWYVDDDSTAVYSTFKYVQVPTDAQIADANTLGWKLSTRLRVVDVDDAPDLTVGARYSNGATRYSMIFGSDADGDPIVVLGEGADDTSVWGPTFTLEGAGSTYHLYELLFDPAAGSADLFVDGTLRLSDYMGVSADTKRVFWGSNNSYTTGHGNYNLVQWEIIPEPSALILLTIGAMGLLACPRQRQRRR